MTKVMETRGDGKRSGWERPERRVTRRGVGAGWLLTLLAVLTFLGTVVVEGVRWRG
jgi:hypothetical protein